MNEPHCLSHSPVILQGKLHTLLDLRGNILTFIRISDGKLHDVSPFIWPDTYLPFIEEKTFDQER
uniref:Uncharacterized protein n=1 Tax=Magnetococcus massalia (strain MO-1) TaxID=451514 RepID=A0A1S7LG61_MAGMO|nr:protein of unknown function [Candidatus Magnetococcus massalia]